MPLKSLAEYETLAAQAHGHLCAGQILGLRLAMHGVQLLGIDDPAGKDRKRLVAYVEIDRCATDAITWSSVRLWLKKEKSCCARNVEPR